MNLLELRNKKPEANTVAVLNYIQELGEMTDVSLNDWDINAVFKGTGLLDLEHSRTEINRLFFQKIKTVDIEEKVKTVVPVDMVKKVETLEQFFRNASRAGTQKQIDNANYNINSFQEKINVYRKQLALAYESYYAKNFNLLSEVESILALGMYEFLDVINNELIFITKPVTCTYHRGNDLMKLPMGIYKVFYSVEEKQISIGKHKDNIMCRKHLNPYGNPVNKFEDPGTRENLCFGDMDTTKNNLLAQGKICEAFKILWSLLTFYKGEGIPHVAFEHYQTEGTINGIPWKEYVEKNMGGNCAYTDYVKEEKKEKVL